LLIGILVECNPRVDATRRYPGHQNPLSFQVDPCEDMLRAIYGVSSAGSTGDWPAKARRFVAILIQGSRP
jgi:hypothetical protein